MIVVKIPASPETCALCSALGQRLEDPSSGVVGFRIGDFTYVLDLESAHVVSELDPEAVDPASAH